jgi:hypothetical protein
MVVALTGLLECAREDMEAKSMACVRYEVQKLVVPWQGVVSLSLVKIVHSVCASAMIPVKGVMQRSTGSITALLDKR